MIDIIFLLLLFFMLSSTFTRFAELPLMNAGGGGAGDGPPLDPRVQLAEASRIERRAPPDAAVIRADGSLVYRGAEITSEAYLAARMSEESGRVALRLVPDRALPAQTLVEIAGSLRAAGAEEIWIVTERGLD